MFFNSWLSIAVFSMVGRINFVGIIIAVTIYIIVSYKHIILEFN